MGKNGNDACPVDTCYADDSYAKTDAIAADTTDISLVADVAVKDLYAIFCNPKQIRDEFGQLYSDQTLEKCKELGVTEQLKRSYTKSLTSLLCKVDDLSGKVCELTGELTGFDCDLLYETQEGLFNMDLKVTKTKVIDDKHVVITTKYQNGIYQDEIGEDRTRIFSMVYENGHFYIDDELGGLEGSLRKYSEKLVEENVATLKELEAHPERCRVIEDEYDSAPVQP